MRIYFDHNATTPVDSAVAETIARVTTEEFGNASSVHHFGQRAKAVLDDARSSVAALLGAEPSEIVFTSGGTESDNFALRGVAEALEPTGRRHLIASSIEHEAVLVTLRALARRGWRTSLLPVDAPGVDLLSLSAHKFNGTKGAGALWIKRGARVTAILTGGKHERSRRAGTENVPAIAGLGVAARLATKKVTTDAPRLAALRNRLEDAILERVPDTAINGD